MGRRGGGGGGGTISGQLTKVRGYLRFEPSA